MMTRTVNTRAVKTRTVKWNGGGVVTGTMLCVALSMSACSRGRNRESSLHESSSQELPARSGQASTDRVATDSVRGVVSEQGAEPLTVLLLTPADGGAPVALTGKDVAMLRRVVGLGIVARGTARDVPVAASAPRGVATFDVESFAVRAVDGVSATDGILRAAGEGYALQLSDGRRLAIAMLPLALRGKLGSRVFIAGPLDRSPVAYGIIAESP